MHKNFAAGQVYRPAAFYRYSPLSLRRLLQDILKLNICGCTVFFLARIDTVKVYFVEIHRFSLGNESKNSIWHIYLLSLTEYYRLKMAVFYGVRNAYRSPISSPAYNCCDVQLILCKLNLRLIAFRFQIVTCLSKINSMLTSATNIFIGICTARNTQPKSY